jgi:hypothetical protein
MNLQAEEEQQVDASPPSPPTAITCSIWNCEVELGAGASVNKISVNLDTVPVGANEEPNLPDGFEGEPESIPASNKVKLGWAAPTVVARAHYSNMPKAREQAKKLNGKTFRGRTLTVSYQVPKPGSGQEYSKHHFSAASGIFSIEIKGLLASDIVEESGRQDLERFTSCSSISFGEPSYTQQKACEHIRHVLEACGLVSLDVLPTDPSDATVTALAQLKDSKGAAEAIIRFHNSAPQVLRHGRLSVEQVHVVKFTITCRQFWAIKGELDLLQDDPGVAAAELHYGEANESRDPMEPLCICVYGPNAKSVGSLRVDMERILQGDRCAVDGKELWDPFFQTEGGDQFFADLNADRKLYARQDSRTRTIRVCGDRDARERAKLGILRRFKLAQDVCHVLPLGKNMLRSLLTGGVVALESETGVDVVDVDVIDLTLHVQGDEDDVRKAHRFLANLQVVIPTSPQMDHLCPVCVCDPTDPVELPCNHTYCLLCLQHQLRTCANHDIVKVICIAEQPVEDAEVKTFRQCGEPIAYHVIHEMLSPTDETALLTASFFSHIRANCEEFRYCPTLGCKVVYKRQERGTITACPECHIQICPACHVQFHEGLTCAEHIEIERRSLQAFQKSGGRIGVRECPKCKAQLEKRGGSHQVECVSCGANVCWACMQTVRVHLSSQHMRERHGGLGVR